MTEAGPVADDADLAVERHVRQAALLRLDLVGVALEELGIALFEVSVAEGGVLVGLKLGVPGDDPAVARHHQRVDLGREGVLLRDCAIELPDHLGQGRRVLAQAGLERQPPQLEVERSPPGVRVEPGDRLRRILGDCLDVHPPLGGEHQDVGTVVAVDGEAEVDLLGDVERALAVDEGHLEALDVHADDGLSGGARLLRRLGRA